MVRSGSPKDGVNLLLRQVRTETAGRRLFFGLFHVLLQFTFDFQFYFNLPPTDHRRSIFGPYEYVKKWSTPLYVHCKNEKTQLPLAGSFRCSRTYLDWCHHYRCPGKHWLLSHHRVLTPQKKVLINISVFRSGESIHKSKLYTSRWHMFYAMAIDSCDFLFVAVYFYSNAPIFVRFSMSLLKWKCTRE